MSANALSVGQARMERERLFGGRRGGFGVYLVLKQLNDSSAWRVLVLAASSLYDDEENQLIEINGPWLLKNTEPL